MDTWIQLGILICSILGCAGAILSTLSKKFKSLEDAMTSLRTDMNKHVEEEVSAVNSRVDNLYLELIKGTANGKTSKGKRD